MGKPSKPTGPGSIGSGASGLSSSTGHLYTLKYIRLSCVDISRTKEFYVSLGMSVEYQLSSNKNPNTPGTPSGAPGTAEEMPKGPGDAKADNWKPRVSMTERMAAVKAKAVAELAGTLMAEPTIAENNASKAAEAHSDSSATPSLYKTDLCLSFVGAPVPGTEPVDQCQFQLVFTNLTTQRPEEKDESNADLAVPPALPPKKSSNVKPKARNQEYLVIYVRFLSRVIKRLASKGFETSLPATSFQGAQIAILTDPNEIEVRLIELTELQLDDPFTSASAKKRQWFARTGYYAIPTGSLDATVQYYERLFSYVGAAGAGNAAVAAAHGGEKKEKRKKGSVVPVEPNPKGVKNANMLGIRAVDSEDYVVGLTKTQFVWLASEPRSLGASICFTGKVVAESMDARQIDKRNSQLMAIGVEVPSLDGLLKRWEWERPNEVIWEPGRTRIPGIGQYSRFKDPHNEHYVEVFTPKTLDPLEAVKDANIALAATAAAAAAATAAAESKVMKSIVEHEPSSALDRGASTSQDAFPLKNKVISKSYLGGISKTLSEGAIRVPEMNEINSVSKAPPPQDVAERPEAFSAPEKILPLPQTIKIKMQKIENDTQVVGGGENDGEEVEAGAEGIAEGVVVGDATTASTKAGAIDATRAATRESILSEDRPKVEAIDATRAVTRESIRSEDRPKSRSAKF
ncbi:hypothetical protein HDU98_003222 [Podochytrium sp. JEL0797]|nr:hypothetical protein HDU98_003222 [Podochytrium sp. JEL0797]